LNFEVRSTIAKTILDEGKSQTCGAVLVVVPVVKVRKRELGRGLHGYIEDSRCAGHGWGRAMIAGSANMRDEIQGLESKSICEFHGEGKEAQGR
jgi:hypothetical protein